MILSLKEEGHKFIINLTVFNSAQNLHEFCMWPSPLAIVFYFCFFMPLGIACFGIFSCFCVRLSKFQNFTRNLVLFLSPKRRTFLNP